MDGSRSQHLQLKGLMHRYGEIVYQEDLSRVSRAQIQTRVKLASLKWQVLWHLTLACAVPSPLISMVRAPWKAGLPENLPNSSALFLWRDWVSGSGLRRWQPREWWCWVWLTEGQWKVLRCSLFLAFSFHPCLVPLSPTVQGIKTRVPFSPK